MDMGRLLMALSLYLGLIFFFAVNAIAIIRGATVATAMARGVSALVLFALLGLVASLAVRVRPQPEGGQREEAPHGR